MARERLVVIGAGMAAGRALEHVVAADRFDITVFNAEPRGSYNRIMLSPVLAGEKNFPDIITHDAAWYAHHGVATRFGEAVHSIDRTARLVHGANGAAPYDKLLIATGSDPFVIPLPGHDLDGVITYRDVEDTNRMMDLRPGAKAVVIGGGLLGLEAAAGMAARGVEVTVVHIMGHLMERQLDPEAGGLLKASLEAKGITVLCEAHSAEVVGENGRVTGLSLKDGRLLPCDLLVMAVGIRPASSIAQDAGIEANRGIVVDDQMRTSDPHIFAIGECVEHRGALFGLVAPLYEQARVLADTLLDTPNAFVQKSLSTKLKVTGCDLFSAGDFAPAVNREEIVFRDPSDTIYKRLVLEEDRLVGAVLYGDTADGAWFFDLIQNGTSIAPLRDTLIFGPAYNAQEDATADPLSAVAAWPRKPGCNGALETNAWAIAA